MRSCFSMPAKELLFPAAFFFLLVNTGAAETLEGKAAIVVSPYLLVQTEKAAEVAIVQPGTVYLDLKGLSELKYGDRWVRVRYSEERSGVKIADQVELLPSFFLDRASSFQHAEEFIAFINKAEKGTYVVIDARERTQWEAGHLPGAVSIPAGSRDSGLPKDRNKLLVFYSQGPHDPAAVIAARKALQEGYQKVKVFHEGVEGWAKEGMFTLVTAGRLKRDRKSGSASLLVDVRPGEKAGEGRIPGALSIPLGSFKKEDFIIPRRPAQLPVVFYGESDTDPSAAEAAKMLFSWNYHREGGVVSVLSGGFSGWAASGEPIAKAPASAAQEPVFPASGEIGYAEFSNLWNSTDSAARFLNLTKQGGKRAGEIQMPMEELLAKIGELPRDREIVIYCYIGLRSEIAYHILSKNGFRARFLKRAVSVGPDGLLLE